MNPLILDFETRSLVDLPRCGTTVYARDPSTEVICIGYQWEGQTYVTPTLGRSNVRLPSRMRDALSHSDTILVAHNALFERAIWTHVLGWSEILPERWYCTSNLAGLYNLPQALGNLTEYMWPNSIERQKDKRGRQLIHLLSRPKPNTTEFREDPTLLQEMYEYCAQDVKTTARIFQLFPPAIEFERRIQLADLQANERGYQVDRAFCEKAKTLDSQLQEKVTSTCIEITGLRPTQTIKLRQWLLDHGLTLPDLSRQTIESYLAGRPEDPIIRKVLELRIAGARGSTQKFEGLLRSCTEEYPRITHHTSYAAGNTARWIARGAQIHNFRSRNLISYDLPGIKGEVMTDTIPSNVDTRNYIGGAVRAAIIAAPEKKLALGDYSGMENRMLMYLSGEERQLSLIREGLDVYRDLATRVFGISDPEKISPWQRQICKHMVLGLGFGMGAYAFFTNLKFHFQVDLTKEICSAIVGDSLDVDTDIYIERLKKHKRLRQHIESIICLDNRPLNRKTIYGLVTTTHLVNLFRNGFVDMSEWWKVLDSTFKDLIHAPINTRVDLSPSCQMRRVKRAIVFELPSGREMYYWYPRYRRAPDPITGEFRSELIYDQATGWAMKTLKGYGARFGANLVQGISRDIMAGALVDLADSDDWDPIITVHDELISETENLEGEVYGQFILASAHSFPWARDIPLQVDVDISDCWLSKG